MPEGQPQVVMVEDEDAMGGKAWWLIETERGWVGFVSARALREDPGRVLDGYIAGLRAISAQTPGLLGVLTVAAMTAQTVWSAVSSPLGGFVA